MRIVLAILAVCLQLAVSPLSAAAQTVTARDDLSQPAERSRKLDELFAALKTARNETDARIIANQIWALWYQSGNEDVDLMMRQSRQALRAGRLQAALARVDQALKVLPSYAEAWNLRATILFHQGEDVASVAAIERTLALEPRHFGALSGMVLINMRAQSWDGALAALRAGLKVHPFLHKPALVEQLEDLAKGKEL